MRRRGRAHFAIPNAVADEIWADQPMDGDGADEAARELLRRLRAPSDLPYERGDFLVAGPGFGLAAASDRVALALARAELGGVLSQGLPPALRNSLLLAGVPTLEAPALLPFIEHGHDLIVDFAAGTLENVSRHRVQVGRGLTPSELQWVRAAPAQQWYGMGLRPHKPDSGDV